MLFEEWGLSYAVRIAIAPDKLAIDRSYTVALP
jgi:hypothetical protein